MPPAVKVVLKYEDDSEPELKTVLKMQLPRKWKEGPTLNIKSSFVETFNSKHPEHKLEVAEVHLENIHGDAFADEDILIRVAKSGDELFIRPGAPPKDPFAPFEVKAQSSDATQKQAAKPPPASTNAHHVASKEAIEEAQAQAKLAFDYSKWDRLDLSDDDGDDCHPNIELESWKRIKARQRAERREKEEQKLEKLNAKISKYTDKVKEVKEKQAKGDDDPQLMVDLKDAEDNLERYQAKLDAFMAKRKLVADDLCEVKEDKSTIQLEESKPVLPEKPVDESAEYDNYVKSNKEMLMKFSEITDDSVSHEYIMSNKHILHSQAEGFMLLLCLDSCMRHLQRPPVSDEEKEKFAQEEFRIAKQHLILNYIMDLAKGLKREPIEAVNPFFRKASARSPEQIKGFEDDLKAFVKRIRKRAQDKIENNEASPLAETDDEEEEYEPAPLGPGGLDPNEVLNSLPQEMADCFIEQDIPKLKQVLMAMPPEEAEQHMKRCIDSGLWVENAADA